jgi:predicted DNA-binding transcriptional regulator YafY
VDQQVAELDDAYEITATVVDSEWLWRWVKGFGAQVSCVTSVQINRQLKKNGIWDV